MKKSAREAPPRRNLRQVTVRALLFAVTLGGVVFLFVLPGRTWLAQSRAISQAQRQSQLLGQENAALTKRVAQLQNPAYIDQIAREQYGLAPPGAEAFGIEPQPAAAPTTAPSR
jgi:cell division protein FtsB